MFLCACLRHPNRRLHDENFEEFDINKDEEEVPHGHKPVKVGTLQGSGKGLADWETSNDAGDISRLSSKRPQGRLIQWAESQLRKPTFHRSKQPVKSSLKHGRIPYSSNSETTGSSPVSLALVEIGGDYGPGMLVKPRSESSPQLNGCLSYGMIGLRGRLGYRYATPYHRPFVYARIPGPLSSPFLEGGGKTDEHASVGPHLSNRALYGGLHLSSIGSPGSLSELESDYSPSSTQDTGKRRTVRFDLPEEGSLGADEMTTGSLSEESQGFARGGHVVMKNDDDPFEPRKSNEPGIVGGVQSPRLASSRAHAEGEQSDGNAASLLLQSPGWPSVSAVPLEELNSDGNGFRSYDGTSPGHLQRSQGREACAKLPKSCPSEAQKKDVDAVQFSRNGVMSRAHSAASSESCGQNGRIPGNQKVDRRAQQPADRRSVPLHLGQMSSPFGEPAHSTQLHSGTADLSGTPVRDEVRATSRSAETPGTVYDAGGRPAQIRHPGALHVSKVDTAGSQGSPATEQVRDEQDHEDKPQPDTQSSSSARSSTTHRKSPQSEEAAVAPRTPAASLRAAPGVETSLPGHRSRVVLPLPSLLAKTGAYTLDCASNSRALDTEETSTPTAHSPPGACAQVASINKDIAESVSRLGSAQDPRCQISILRPAASDEFVRTEQIVTSKADGDNQNNNSDNGCNSPPMRGDAPWRGGGDEVLRAGGGRTTSERVQGLVPPASSSRLGRDGAYGSRERHYGKERVLVQEGEKKAGADGVAGEPKRCPVTATTTTASHEKAKSALGRATLDTPSKEPNRKRPAALVALPGCLGSASPVLGALSRNNSSSYLESQEIRAFPPQQIVDLLPPFAKGGGGSLPMSVFMSLLVPGNNTDSNFQSTARIARTESESDAVLFGNNNHNLPVKESDAGSLFTASPFDLDGRLSPLLNFLTATGASGDPAVAKDSPKRQSPSPLGRSVSDRKLVGFPSASFGSSAAAIQIHRIQRICTPIPSRQASYNSLVSALASNSVSSPWIINSRLEHSGASSSSSSAQGSFTDASWLGLPERLPVQSTSQGLSSQSVTSPQDEQAGNGNGDSAAGTGTWWGDDILAPEAALSPFESVWKTKTLAENSSFVTSKPMSMSDALMGAANGGQATGADGPAGATSGGKTASANGVDRTGDDGGGGAADELQNLLVLRRLLLKGLMTSESGGAPPMVRDSGKPPQTGKIRKVCHETIPVVVADPSLMEFSLRQGQVVGEGGSASTGTTTPPAVDGRREEEERNSGGSENAGRYGYEEATEGPWEGRASDCASSGMGRAFLSEGHYNTYKVAAVELELKSAVPGDATIQSLAPHLIAPPCFSSAWTSPLFSSLSAPERTDDERIMCTRDGGQGGGDVGERESAAHEIGIRSKIQMNLKDGGTALNPGTEEPWSRSVPSRSVFGGSPSRLASPSRRPGGAFPRHLQDEAGNGKGTQAEHPGVASHGSADPDTIAHPNPFFGIQKVAARVLAVDMSSRTLLQPVASVVLYQPLPLPSDEEGTAFGGSAESTMLSDPLREAALIYAQWRPFEVFRKEASVGTKLPTPVDMLCPEEAEPQGVCAAGTAAGASSFVSKNRPSSPLSVLSTAPTTTTTSSCVSERRDSSLDTLQHGDSTMRLYPTCSQLSLVDSVTAID